MTLLLRRATFADGIARDVRVVEGRIAAIGDLRPVEGDAELDLTGLLLLPACAEPHAHLDKAFLAEVVPNPTGDLMGAIVAMEQHRHLITLDDTIERAERAARLMLSNGVTAIRTHADLTLDNGLRSVEALLEVRSRLTGIVDVQVCALTGWPSVGREGAEQRALLRAAIAAGIDVVGGCPHLEADPEGATDGLLSIAGEAGLPLDLHTDETLHPGALAVDHLAKRVLATGFPHRVAASHCVSLGVQPIEVQQAVAERIATAGIDVIALPHTNLFLQGRDHRASTPRGLTAVRSLAEAGVNVAAGADNLQDPFNPVGRGDPLETAALMIMVGHLLPDDAYRSVSHRARLALGLPPNDLVVGAVADLVAIAARTVRSAIADGPGGRIVLRHGVVMNGRMVS